MSPPGWLRFWGKLTQPRAYLFGTFFHQQELHPVTVGLCDIDGNSSADLMEDHGSEIVSDTSVYWHAAVARLDSVTDIR